ncbi:hypothetical protein C1631_004875 [Chryseobacterium phosphatilyticum]|uniref:Uncharacterized protein n=1 Tax=Chryseobacterium phosphatilyticum TaxID=475075 RepID=A0A316XDN4_9FLAO|nr:hypothetical protein [Chryseobacterium phosphatilyticum]PWN71952.1 hypothetical protein C1631_004875 [Chryseobacterium phosphatilyticum]
MKNEIYQDPVKNKLGIKNSMDDDWQKMDFLFHSACSYPFIPMVDLSFVVEELIKIIKNWKREVKTKKKQALSKEPHATS